MSLIKMFTVADKKEINEEERSIVAWGSKAVVDRDGELIKGDAWDVSSFRKNPVLLLSHDYRQPPIGKVLWVKKTEEGLKFKAQFARTQVADEVYNLYKDDIMRAFSVGFIPKEWEDVDHEEQGKSKGNKLKRIYTNVELLEISCVSVPACPDALIEAYGEGKIKTKALELALRKVAEEKDTVTKPEETENYIRLPVPEEEGKHDGHKIRTITISKKQGIKALYCVDCKVIITYLFDKSCKHKPNKCDWTMEEAQAWMREHSKKQRFICECINCGYITETDKHCKDLKCPECGGQMRRIERPGAGQDSYEVDDMKIEKGVIPFKETPKAPEDTPWDAAREVREASVDDLKIMCAWYDSENPNIKQSYKLPHHRASGKHPVVWRGVATAMATLFGARGGVNIPDADRKGVYNHLVKHYKQFDKEPPEFREYTEEELKELFLEIYKNEEDELLSAIYDLKKEIAFLKEGRVLSEKNRKLIQSTIQQMREAISALEELLKATEPKQDIVDLDKIDVRDFYDEDNKDKDIEIDEEEIAKVIKEELKELFKIAKPEPVDYKKLAQEMIDKAKGKVK